MNEPMLAAAREPQQGRSRASYERMLAAASRLLEKRGSADFTLNDVAKAGKVSIGSIYLRFDSKDDLLNVVHGRLLAQIDETQLAMLASVIARADDLRTFMTIFVEEFAEMLRKFAPRLRPAMLRAMTNPHVSSMGSGSHNRFAEKVQNAMLAYASEIGRPDRERTVGFAFRVIYSTIARFLGLGSSLEAAGQGNWSEIKADLAELCTSYLIGADIAGVPAKAEAVAAPPARRKRAAPAR